MTGILILRVSMEKVMTTGARTMTYVFVNYEKEVIQ